MPKGRTASPPGRALPPKPAWLALAFMASTLTLLAASSCQKEDTLKPGELESNIVTAVYATPEQASENPIELDGKALQKEWGGPLESERPYVQIRLSQENGGGYPGEPVYLSMKAVYTDRDLFLLLQWADAQADEMKDLTVYQGPDLRARIGCQPILMEDSLWTRSYGGQVWDEDRLYLAFEIGSAGNEHGTFRTDGCHVACHTGQNPQFGRPGYGRLDLWQWLATRTNRVRNLYIPTDNPNFPKYGIPAYLEDGSADPVSAIAPDPGTACWRRNWLEGHNAPLYVYRPLDDPFANPQNPSECFNAFGEKCVPNNALPFYYIWREDIERPAPEFTSCDTMNFAVLPAGQEARKWRPGDAVGGYYYTYPSGSRADVRGKAVLSEGVWTLEVARPLDTRDPGNDVIFRGEPGEDAYFTAAIANNSRENHWGSAPQILRFGPKVQRGRASDQGGGR